MAEVKISELTSATTPLAGTETVPIVQGGVTKKVAVSEIGGGGGTAWGGITGTLSSQTDLDTALSGKQTTLVSGTSIKTIEGQSILGSGNIDLTKSDVGLSNVDNTSDLSKPISTATETALNAKQASLVSGTNIKTINGSSVLGSGDLTISGGGGASGIHTQILGGGSMFGGVETSNMVSSANLSSYVCQANQMTYFPYVPNKTFTSTTLSFNVVSATAGAKCKLLIYSHNGINTPQNKLYESTEIDLSSTGGKTISTSFTFTAGTIYWFGIYSNISGPNISAMTANGGGALPMCFIGTALILAWVQVSLAYPTAPSVAGPNSFQTNAPLIRLK